MIFVNNFKNTNISRKINVKIFNKIVKKSSAILRMTLTKNTLKRNPYTRGASVDKQHSIKEIIK